VAITDSGIYDLLTSNYDPFYSQEIFSIAEKCCRGNDDIALQVIRREFGSAVDGISSFTQCMETSPIHNIPFVDSVKRRNIENKLNTKFKMSRSFVYFIEKFSSYLAIEPEDLYCLVHYFTFDFGETAINSTNDEEDSCDEDEDYSEEILDTVLENMNPMNSRKVDLGDLNVAYPAVLVISGECPYLLICFCKIILFGNIILPYAPKCY